jgi:hypothetical protein
MTSSVQTLVAVILGAVLAALGGFVATQPGIRIDRARRARDAALLAGEILAGIATLLRLAERAAGENGFMSPLPMRFFSAARHEIEVYDRNRELLFCLGNADLTARIHGLVIRLSIPLDRLADDHGRYRALCASEGAPPTMADGLRPSSKADGLRQEMEQTFAYLVASRAMIPDLLALLQPIARVSFDSYSRINSDGVPVRIPR